MDWLERGSLAHSSYSNLPTDDDSRVEKQFNGEDVWIDQPAQADNVTPTGPVPGNSRHKPAVIAIVWSLYITNISKGYLYIYLLQTKLLYSILVLSDIFNAEFWLKATEKSRKPKKQHRSGNSRNSQDDRGKTICPIWVVKQVFFVLWREALVVFFFFPWWSSCARLRACTFTFHVLSDVYFNRKTENIKDKVKEATSNKQWGPTGGQMAEIANASFNL